MWEPVSTMLETALGPTGLAAMGAGIAIILTGMSSARGLEVAGHSAAGVTAEDDKNFKNALVLQALPTTQVIYGFIIGVIIVFFGIMSEKITSLDQGWRCLMAGLAVGFTGYSAVNQGRVASSGIGASAKNQSILSKVMVYAVMPETAALFGFVTAFLLLLSANLF